MSSAECPVQRCIGAAPRVKSIIVVELNKTGVSPASLTDDQINAVAECGRIELMKLPRKDHTRATFREIFGTDDRSQRSALREITRLVVARMVSARTELAEVTA